MDLPFCHGDVQAAEQLQRLPAGEGDRGGGIDGLAVPVLLAGAEPNPALDAF